MIKNLFQKHKEVITYIIFGALTTAVNFISFYLLELITEPLEISYLINNAIAWFISVVFAYVTNKLFVFESKSWKAKLVVREVLEFFGGRVFSFAVEEAGLWLFVDTMRFGDFSVNILGFELTGELIAKLILAVIVIIMNYFFSKFIIFAKKEK